MNQSRAHSLIESCLNTASGFVLSMLAVAWVFPLIGVTMNLAENFGATGIMTAVSLARSYVIRRLFVWIHGRRASKLDEACALMREAMWRISDHGHRKAKARIAAFLEGMGK
jgi:hypothetical protein